MFNAILQVNAIYFQRRKKLLAIINLMNNTQKWYKKKQLLIYISYTVLFSFSW